MVDVCIYFCVSQMDQHFADILADRERSTGPKKDVDGNKHDDPHHHHHHHEAEGGAPKRGGAQAGHGQQHRHGHDRLGAQSVGVELAEGPIDWTRFTSWLKSFLEKEGDELIWRLKGVLWTSAAPGHGSGAATTWGWGAGRRTVVQVRTSRRSARRVVLPHTFWRSKINSFLRGPLHSLFEQCCDSAPPLARRKEAAFWFYPPDS